MYLKDTYSKFMNNILGEYFVMVSCLTVHLRPVLFYIFEKGEHNYD